MKLTKEKLIHLSGRLRFLANPADFNDHTCEALNDSADALEKLANIIPTGADPDYSLALAGLCTSAAAMNKKLKSL